MLVLKSSARSVVTLVLLLLSIGPLMALSDHYDEASTCEFTTSLQFGYISSETDEVFMGCSGLMLTAAHCEDNIDQSGEAYVYSGEDWQDPACSTSNVECVRHPGSRQGDELYEGPDIAYCNLGCGSASDPSPEPPIVPVMVPNSCENDSIRHALFSSHPSATNFPDEPFGLNIHKIFTTASSAGLNDPSCELSTDGRVL